MKLIKATVKMVMLSVMLPCFCFVLVLLINANAALALPTEAPPFKWRPGDWRGNAQLQYYTTRANYDRSRGSFSSFSGGRSFTSYESLLTGRYSFSEEALLLMGVGYNNVIARDSTTERTNGNITQIAAGLDYKILSQPLPLIAEFELSYSTDSIKTSTTKALTSDGVSYGRAEIFSQIPYRRFRLLSHAGLKIPDEGLAKLFIFGLGLEMGFAKKFVAGAGLEGHETLIKDELTETQRTSVTDRVNASSHHFYAWNPSLIDAQGWVSYYFSPMARLKIGFSQSLSGINAAVGQSLFASFSFGFAKSKSVDAFSVKTKRDLKTRRERAARAFDVETEKDKEQEQLFDPDDDELTPLEEIDGDEGTEKKID